MAKFCRYLSGHPAVATELAAAQGMDGPEFLTAGYCAAAYESQYGATPVLSHDLIPSLRSNCPTSKRWVAFRPIRALRCLPVGSALPAGYRLSIRSALRDCSGLSVRSATQLLRPINPFHRMGRNAPTYQSAYPESRVLTGATPRYPGQTLAGSAIGGLLARFLGNNGLQNYGGYNGAPGPAPQPPYSVVPYPAGP